VQAYRFSPKFHLAVRPERNARPFPGLTFYQSGLAFDQQLPLDNARYASFRGGRFVRHPIDIAVMFAALWLLGSMVVDILTPKELTVYMIAAATGPAAIGTALCYFLQIPKIDFAMIFASLWLTALMAIEWISPAPLPNFVIGGAFAPALIVGAVLHWHQYRSNDRRRAIVKKIEN